MRRLGLVLLLGLAACRSGTSERVGEHRYEPTAPADVKLLDVPPPGAVRIATVVGYDWDVFKSPLDDARELAAGHGADAIVVTSWGHGNLPGQIIPKSVTTVNADAYRLRP